MEVLNFCGDLLSRYYLPCEYRENKSLTKLNSVTVLYFGSRIGWEYFLFFYLFHSKINRLLIKLMKIWVKKLFPRSAKKKEKRF